MREAAVSGVRSGRRAFALVETGAIVAVSGALLALLLVIGGESRRQARLGEDCSKLRQIGAWTTSYAADSADRFWSFSWRKGQSLSQWPELNNAQDDIQAAANQAVDILRRVAGRPDIGPISAWVPHLLYNHLVLQDHLTSRLPDLAFVSGADKARLAWARDPLGFDAGLYGGPGPSTSNPTKRWPYSSSFQMPTAFYDASAPGSRVAQAGFQNFYSIPTAAQLGGRPIPLTAFPSAKVMFHDHHARHFGARVAFALHADARLPLLFVDGSVLLRRAADANPGWQPNSPASATPTTLSYSPSPWEPPALSGTPSDPIEAGRFRWTRGTATEHGIAGRDFGGPETCSGQLGCP